MREWKKEIKDRRGREEKNERDIEKERSFSVNRLSLYNISFPVLCN